jgi:PRTRC genetic system protein B
MKNISNLFADPYDPKLAVLIYQNRGKEANYVEVYDIAPDGRPINARPLSLQESIELSVALKPVDDDPSAFLRSKGLMPDTVLHINSVPGEELVIWYTPQRMTADLYFSKALGIPSGRGMLPGLIWYANRSSLRIFAFAGKGRPNEKTALCYAPFFNISEGGSVCMGTVNTEISNSATLQQFMQAWQNFFFNSYFSHLMNGHNPITGNVVQLWENLIGTDKPFPVEVLRKSSKTLRSLVS